MVDVSRNRIICRLIGVTEAECLNKECIWKCVLRKRNGYSCKDLASHACADVLRAS